MASEPYACTLQLFLQKKIYFLNLEDIINEGIYQHLLNREQIYLNITFFEIMKIYYEIINPAMCGIDLTLTRLRHILRTY